MADKAIKEHLQEHFKGKEYFTRNELFDFYRKFEPLKETTFRWRLFNLKENKIIRSLTKDIFTFNSLPDYYPEVTNENKELISLLKFRSKLSGIFIWTF